MSKIFLRHTLTKKILDIFDSLTLKQKKQVLALVLIEDLGFLPLVREIQRLSTGSATLHS